MKRWAIWHFLAIPYAPRWRVSSFVEGDYYCYHHYHCHHPMEVVVVVEVMMIITYRCDHHDCDPTL